MRTIGLTVLALVLAASVISAVVNVRHRETITRTAAGRTGGDPERGRERMAALGCVACHTVPGFSGTKPNVGPSLASFASGTFVAGVAENTPENVIQFIRNPRSLAPKSAMPDLHVSEQDARDIAAYLYTLQ